ncbi:hypothetical protein Cni_G28494 [Canna indica]|uniref:Uncharacterized protein n=1 Tax=Canna indica TaxID=4628 RepID=A0AAQ3L2M1_9LILI|nr:hypothetical protein Cni_G28494 [Canna indica]
MPRGEDEIGREEMPRGEQERLEIGREEWLTSYQRRGDAREERAASARWLITNLFWNPAGTVAFEEEIALHGSGSAFGEEIALVPESDGTGAGLLLCVADSPERRRARQQVRPCGAGRDLGEM